MVYLSRQEISDFLEKDAIEGPLDRVRIEQRDTPLDSGYERCRKKASRIARKGNFNIIERVYDGWVSGNATMEFQFYRFKFDPTSSSSSGHHEQDQGSR